MRGDGERDDIVPLFPGLRINNDEEKGGPRPPPRNKMAIFDVDSEVDYRSRPSVPPRNDSVSSFASRGSSSSSNVSFLNHECTLLADSKIVYSKLRFICIMHF